MFVKQVTLCLVNGPFHKYHVKLPRYFSGNSQKRLLNVTSNFIKFLENPSKNLLFLSKKYNDFQSLKPKFSKFHCSSRSPGGRFRHFDVISIHHYWKIAALALSDMERILSSGKSLNWIVSGV